uniref:Uncharacterized protein n=1 Tax=Rhizophora mucronata TaxID=61149 RepID=A0A2P2MYF8_RHIMU
MESSIKLFDFIFFNHNHKFLFMSFMYSHENQILEWPENLNLRNEHINGLKLES